MPKNSKRPQAQKRARVSVEGFDTSTLAYTAEQARRVQETTGRARVLNPDKRYQRKPKHSKMGWSE